MNGMTIALETAGATAAAARVMAPVTMPPAVLTSMPAARGYVWQSVVSPCDHADFAKAINTTKRQPRRLGQRST